MTKIKIPDIYEGMNKTETEHARHLEHLRMEQVILAWKYESLRFRLADRTTYTPDFLVVTPERIEIHETKGGFIRDDAIVKFKMARELYPWFEWIMYQKKGKVWIVR